jgi:hypothetical protein
VSHSAKRARYTVYRQSLLCRVFFLGHSAKRFAECQTALGKQKQPLRRRVTETASLPSAPVGTRQRSYLCRVSVRQHSANNPPLPSITWDTRQRTYQRGSPGGTRKVGAPCSLNMAINLPSSCLKIV